MAGHAPTPCASGDTSDQWQTGFRAVHVAVVADPRWEASGETAAGFGCSPESSTVRPGRRRPDRATAGRAADSPSTNLLPVRLAAAAQEGRQDATTCRPHHRSEEAGEAYLAAASSRSPHQRELPFDGLRDCHNEA